MRSVTRHILVNPSGSDRHCVPGGDGEHRGVHSYGLFRDSLGNECQTHGRECDHLAAHCSGVAASSPPTTSTSVPCPRRYRQRERWALIAAQWSGEMFCGSRSFAEARPDSIRDSTSSMSPLWQAENRFCTGGHGLISPCMPLASIDPV